MGPLKPFGEALTLAAIRLREFKNVIVDRIVKVRMVKQVFCKEVVSSFPDCLW